MDANNRGRGLGVELEASTTAPWHPYPLARGGAGSAPVSLDALPLLDLERSRELDRIMVDELGITLERMMENAGRQLARVARERLGMSVGGRRVAVLAGSGGNGGGGLVAARHLANAGATISIHLSGRPAELTPPLAQYPISIHLSGRPAEPPVPLAQYEILMRMGIEPSVPDAGRRRCSWMPSLATACAALRGARQRA